MEKLNFSSKNPCDFTTENKKIKLLRNINAKNVASLLILILSSLVYPNSRYYIYLLFDCIENLYPNLMCTGLHKIRFDLKQSNKTSKISHQSIKNIIINI